MINKTYAKRCNVHTLQQEIIVAGCAVYPNSGYDFYGCCCDQLADNSWQTTVMMNDNISSGDKSTIDGVVATHINVPTPETEAPVDSEGRTFVRAESKPTDMTTYFTSKGDTADEIGGGDHLSFDFNNTDNDIASPPTGFKQKRVCCSFIDVVRLKEGTAYWENCPFGSMIDLCLGVPDWDDNPAKGWYLKNDGTPAQNKTGEPLSIAKFVNDSPMMGDCPMGDEMNTEAASNEIPLGTIFGFLVTVPDTVSDTDNCHGVIVLELYRKRTVILE